jgi:Fe-S-cluster containining protein
MSGRAFFSCAGVFDSARVSTLSNLCVACGLCCDGSLFRFVPAEPAELEVWAALGLPIVTRAGRPAMALPCRRLEKKCCTVYAQRPSGCRGFVCHLGRQLEEGTVAFPRALDLVKEAQRRIEVLRRVWPLEGALVQTATSRALAGKSPSREATEALQDVQAWLDAYLHWPQT